MSLSTTKHLERAKYTLIHEVPDSRTHNMHSQQSSLLTRLSMLLFVALICFIAKSLYELEEQNGQIHQSAPLSHHTHKWRMELQEGGPLIAARGKNKLWVKTGHMFVKRQSKAITFEKCTDRNVLSCSNLSLTKCIWTQDWTVFNLHPKQRIVAQGSWITHLGYNDPVLIPIP